MGRGGAALEESQWGRGRGIGGSSCTTALQWLDESTRQNHIDCRSALYTLSLLRTMDSHPSVEPRLLPAAMQRC